MDVRDGGPGERDGGREPPFDAGPGLDAGADGGGGAADKARVVSVAPTYVVASEPYKYGPKSSEPGQTSWKVAEGPDGMTADGTGVVAWEPTKGQGGKHKVTVETTVDGKAITQTSTVTVATSEKKAGGKASKGAGGTVIVNAPKSKVQGTSVSVPKNAVDVDTTVVISELDASPKMPGKKGGESVVHFGPSGTVFKTPALVSLPLPRDVELVARRLGAYVYDPRGRWVRVPVVRVDLQNRLIHARAPHFSSYAGAEATLALDLALERASGETSCEDGLSVSGVLDELLSEVGSDVVNNEALLAARIESGASDLDALLFSDEFRGSMRFARVFDLLAADGETTLGQTVQVSTLYAPGDGTAVVSHTDGLGNLLARFPFESLIDDAGDIASHLRGQATRALFSGQGDAAVGVAARLHVVYYDGDASLDPVNVAELGLAALDQVLAPAVPAVRQQADDLDCDGLLLPFDELDSRLTPGLAGEPRDLVSTVVGGELSLAVEPRHVPAGSLLQWEVFGAGATLANAGEHRRTFVASAPGRFVVEVSLATASETLRHAFVIDVLPMPISLPACTPVSVADVMRMGENAVIEAVLDESTRAADAVAVEWGLSDGSSFVSDPSLFASGRFATFTPPREGLYTVACRTVAAGVEGAPGEMGLTVLAADANRLPVDLILSPAAQTLTIGQSLTLHAAGHDLDGDTLNYTWTASGGTLGTPELVDGESRAVFSAEAAGQYVVRVSIDDGTLPQELTANVLVVSQLSDLNGADEDRDGWPVPLDCNDTNAAVNPGAFDACGDAVDEDCSGTPRTLDCDGDGQSTEEGDCDDANARVLRGAAELCDGLDNDCSGFSDDPYTIGKPCSVGVGACARQALFVCRADGAGNMCDVVPGSPSIEICNGVDDDCDGLSDEDLAPVATTCGLGACFRSGEQRCIQGRPVDSCTPGVAAESDLTCNTIDDDCDGAVDEDYQTVETSCGRGACMRSGTRTCVSGLEVDSCVEGQPAFQDDTCNGVDEDCSGEADEDYVARALTCGSGVCQASGQTRCQGGVESNECTALPPAGPDSSCDGVDQDCSGVADDGVVRLSEVCNGRDDDCDGQVDENLSCSSDPGSCEPSGAEVCNLQDDDCDGLFDENGVCGLILAPDSLLGVWWTCSEQGCATLADRGLMFVSDGLLYGLGTEDEEDYDPAQGPYCGADLMRYTLVGDELTVRWNEGTSEEQAVGNISFEGDELHIDWSIPPENADAFDTLRRVPEQAGGLCDRGPSCQPAETCGNGFDDDCDGQDDAHDPDCTGCSTTPTPETCNGRDDDCDGQIDELDTACEAAAQGVCQRGRMVCDPNQGPVCVAGPPDAAGEVCPDGVDNDCDGQTDEPGCAQLTSGETCFNAVNVGGGGTFHVEVGARNDASGACRPGEYDDRMFVFQVPEGPGLEYSILLRGASERDIGAALVEAPPGWGPALGCPATLSDKGVCIGANGGQFRQYLSGGRTYLLVLESSPSPSAAPREVTLSVAYLRDGLCFPQSGDGDPYTICAGDCDDSEKGVGPGATELCNGRDDDCDGFVDEQSGTCATGQPGACALGIPTCEGAGACLPIQTASPVDYCGDDTDNDCDGASDETCVDAAGEACTNARPVASGGSFSGTLAGTNDDAISRCDVGAPSGRELFYRVTVPRNGELFFQSLRANGVRFALYGGCTLEPVRCDLRDMRERLAPGDYVIAVEEDTRLPGGTREFAFSVGVSDGETCLTPDQDGDGQTVCAGDCDDTNENVFRGASEGETCNGSDDDCNGAIDDVTATCTVPGQLGACAVGRLRCSPNAACEQVVFAGAGTVDACGDDLDNDCDGLADGLDPEGCVEFQTGDLCSQAEELGEGGTFDGTLEGFHDDAVLGCGDAGPERFYAITLQSERRLRLDVHGDSAGQFPGVAILRSCAESAIQCSDGKLDTVLPGGRYLIAVHGEPNANFTLAVASSAPDDVEGETCAPGDLDEDGYNLCNGDCDEGDRSRNRTALEVCDGVDNDCDGLVDERTGEGGTETCIVESGLGLCAQGIFQCVEGETQCVARVAPGQFTEVCQNDVDEDCDGMADDVGVPGEDCFEASGESCQLAAPFALGAYPFGTLVGKTDDGGGCYGGIEGRAEDAYHRFDKLGAGYVRMVVVPTQPGKPPPYSVGILSGECGTEDRQCVSESQSAYYYLPESGAYRVVVEADEPLDYQIQISDVNADFACVTPDQDGDGFDLCQNDCNDARADTYPGAREICDGFDNDCNGQIDDFPGQTCTTELPGVCATGQPVCEGEAEVCRPSREPRARDLCADGLDNDCDGQTDEADCDERPLGETCELARDVTGGGRFEGSLVEASDDGVHCAGGGSPDSYFRFTLDVATRIYLDVIATTQVGNERPFMSAQIYRSCASPEGFGCGYPRWAGGELPAGEYIVAVEGNQPVSFELMLAFDRGEGCEVDGGSGGDFDGDGVTLCAGDCDEGDPQVNPNAAEVCSNGRDDDCDGYQDYIVNETCTSAQPGVCAAGRLRCPEVGSAPVCVPDVVPGTLEEVCADGLDNNCSNGVDEAACVPATGAGCALAIVLDALAGQFDGNIVDPIDDAPGCGFQGTTLEQVFRVTAPADGFLFASVEGQEGATGSFRVYSAEGVCFGPGQCHSDPGNQARSVRQGQTYFLVVEGPANLAFRLFWSFRPGSDRFVGDCLAGTLTGVGDFDGDGVSLCDADCNEADGAIHPGASEICGNQRDDDCDLVIDGANGLCTTGLPGLCEQGLFTCTVSGEPPACEPQQGPRAESCNGVDDDCDGTTDEGCITQ